MWLSKLMFCTARAPLGLASSFSHTLNGVILVGFTDADNCDASTSTFGPHTEAALSVSIRVNDEIPSWLSRITAGRPEPIRSTSLSSNTNW